jgi:hypothetical protein
MRDFENLPQREAMINQRNKGAKKRRTKHKAEKRNEHTPSYMEVKIAEYLDELGEDYICEKVFQNCVSILFNVPLPFDFYLPKHRVVFESDGLHHSRKMDNDKYSYSYDRRILNDKTRELFCIKRGIKLVRIDYTEFKNYKEIINKTLGY